MSTLPTKRNRVFHIKNVESLQNFANNKVVPFSTIPQKAKTPAKPNYVVTIKNWFRENLRHYCDTTSLHGLNYITRTDISHRERVFWISVVVISITVSIVLVTVSWFWNRDNPTVTVIESSHFPTWNVPFPAVTICNFNKISKKKAYALAKRMKRPANVTEEKLLQLFRITMYFSFALNYTEVDYRLFEDILTMNKYSVRELTDDLTPNCMDMISKCLWKGNNARCDSLFQRINTMEGNCCSFNYFGEASNNFPIKIAYQVPKLPYRVTGCGYPTGLSVLLKPDTEDYFATYFSSYGFRLLIHNSYDYPDENSESKVVTSTRESFVRINPESTYATNDVKGMAVEERNCLFASERSLSVMQRYSFINCMSECRVEMLYKRCGCVPINLPNNGSYPICSLSQIYCIIEGREIFIRALPNLDATLSKVKNTKTFPCNCMPDCEANRYPSEITVGRLNVEYAYDNLKSEKTDNETIEDNILLHVFFSDLMSTRYRMEIFQNWLSALASIGGLLGLIMGFSIVTAFEFFYFLTFRPIFNYFNNE